VCWRGEEIHGKEAQYLFFFNPLSPTGPKWTRTNYFLTLSF